MWRNQVITSDAARFHDVNCYFFAQNHLTFRGFQISFSILLCFRNVFQTVKTLDEQKSKFSSVALLFAEDVTAKRDCLIVDLETIILEDFETIGRKSRDILWRKVYYDPISISKRLLKTQSNNLSEDEVFQLVNFIKAAIKNYKTLVLKFEDLFSLDLRFIIDFGIIANGAEGFEKKTTKEIYTANEMNHAIETIHTFLVCLGDLHRYCIEFNFSEHDVSINTSKDLAAKYYVEAFKLNPKLGSPHNQLGTLLAGENQEIDSIFHYLYSLCSPVPFDLSEANVSRIFQQNVEALEKNCDQVSEGFNLKEFIQQLILVIDIFFYDKEIGEFNTLCRTVLVSFKEYLAKNRRSHQADVTFQITSIFMLCLLKLKIKNSPKVHSLNAFLVAFCAEIVEVAIVKAENFIECQKDENLKFCDSYNKRFFDFDRKIKLAREKTQETSKNDSESDQKNGHAMSIESKSTSQEAEIKVPIKIAKKPLPQTSNHNRRRRKRCKGSESDGTSDDSDSESEESDNESMNSDFDSYDDFSDRYSEDDEDVVIENEEIVYQEDLPEKSYEFENEDDVVIEEVVEEAPGTSEEELKLKYKKKYTKVNPSILIQFGELHDGWMKSLKILFDWLRLNNDILMSCYRSNPEFIGQIMKLINLLNIDIFTRKIFFERGMLTVKNVRENLRHLFDVRHTIPTREDVVFKKCMMFDELQRPLEWELSYKLQVTSDEDVILRNFKIIDFGFYLCKMKKFHYSFCARSRVFIEKVSGRRGDGRRGDRRQRKVSNENNGGGKRGGKRRERRRNRKRKNPEINGFERMSIQKHEEEEIEYPSIEQSNQRSCRKGYLRNKPDKENDDIEKKNELMGKLWLKSEIQSLESKKHSVALTPYIMLDSKCLTDYLYIVKNLVKSKKFVVLIPKAGEQIKKIQSRPVAYFIFFSFVRFR